MSRVWKFRVISQRGACQTCASSTKDCSTPAGDEVEGPKPLLKLLITSKTSVVPSKDSCAFSKKGLTSCNRPCQSETKPPFGSFTVERGQWLTVKFYLVALISDLFSVVESLRFSLLPLSLSGIWRNARLWWRLGFECATVVRGRRNPKPGVGAVEHANRVDENGVRIFEPANPGVQKRSYLTTASFRVLHYRDLQEPRLLLGVRNLPPYQTGSIRLTYPTPPTASELKKKRWLIVVE